MSVKYVEGKDFGDVVIRSKSKHSLRVHNNYSHKLYFKKTKSSNNQFKVQNVEGKSLRPGEELDIAVTFSPTKEGSFFSDISVEFIVGNTQEPDVFVRQVQGSGVPAAEAAGGGN